MAFSSACQCLFTLLLLFIAASPLQTHARESRFFSKVSRAQNPKTQTETENISPSSSPSTAAEAKTEQGYGLFGEEETYQYSPTTTNPTKSETRKFKYVEPNGVKEANNGYHYEAGEKQGMSDTRFLENGKYYYDINSEKEVAVNNGKLMEEDDGHESYYGHGYENGNQFKEERYETRERQGMSDTRSLENGKYFYHLGEEDKKKNNGGYENNAEFYKTNKYGNEEEEEEEEEEKYGTRAYRTGERQGMSDTRFLENGKYYYDINSEDPNGVESYKKAKNDEYYEKESYNGESSPYDSNYEKENEKSGGYDFRRTPNKFPRYEFDSMEEYEKYEQGRSHQKEYAP